MSWAQSFSCCRTDKWYEREQSEAKLNGFLEEKHTASEHTHCWINIHVYPYMHIPCEIFAIYRIGRLEHIHGKGNDSQKSKTLLLLLCFIKENHLPRTITWDWSPQKLQHISGLIRGSRPANEKRRYQETSSLIVSLQMFCFILPIGLLYSLYLYIYDQHLLLNFITCWWWQLLKSIIAVWFYLYANRWIHNENWEVLVSIEWYVKRTLVTTYMLQSFMWNLHIRVTGLCEGNPPVTDGFSSKDPVMRKKCFHLMTSSWLSVFCGYIWSFTNILRIWLINHIWVKSNCTIRRQNSTKREPCVQFLGCNARQSVTPANNPEYSNK